MLLLKEKEQCLLAFYEKVLGCSYFSVMVFHDNNLMWQAFLGNLSYR